MNRWILAFALGLLICSAASAQAAQPSGAYGDYGCSPWGYGWNGGYGFGLAYREPLPHYALYPPVYYSLPVPRTYGYSPFAYPGTVMTPEVVDEKSETIINPHVPQPAEEAEKPTAMRVTSRVRVIANPYVSGNAALASLTQ